MSLFSRIKDFFTPYSPKEDRMSIDKLLIDGKPIDSREVLERLIAEHIVYDGKTANKGDLFVMVMSYAYSPDFVAYSPKFQQVFSIVLFEWKPTFNAQADAAWIVGEVLKRMED